MRTYATVTENRERLMSEIKNELDAYDKNLKEARTELLAIGERNKAYFDKDKRLVFEEGYLHISSSTAILKGRNFDPTTFAKARPDMIEVTLKVKPIKDAFLDKDQRKELASLGVSVTTEETVQVKLKSKGVS